MTTSRATSTIEELDGLAPLASLAREWSDLADRDPAATPFQRPEWLLPYCRATGSNAPWAVALRRGGRLVALAPLVVFEDRGRRIATLLGGGLSDWQDALVDPELAPDGAARLLGRIAERSDRYDALLLERLPAGSPLAALSPPGLAAEEEGPDEPCPVLALPARFEDLAGVSSTRLLRDVRHGQRRLGGLGEVRFVAADASTADAVLDALFALHEARWRGRGEPGVLAEPRVQRFHREVARGLAARGALRSFVLALDGRPVAALHAFAEKDRVFDYVAGFDPAVRGASPGVLAIAHGIEEAIRAGAREVDMGRGREPYKYEWGARDRAAARRVLAVRRGPSPPGA